MPKKMKIESAHYTNFGASMAPPCADSGGFLNFRQGFEALPETEWTEAESWVYYANKAIEEWHNGQ